MAGTGSAVVNARSDGFAADLMRGFGCFIFGTGVRFSWGCVLTMAVFITQCPLTSSLVVIAPHNVMSMERVRVRMECTRDLSNLPVDWEFAPEGSNKTSYIYTNRQIPADLTSKYKIDTDNQTQYDLVIDSVDSSHGGTYICTPVVKGTSNAQSASAQLIVLESDPVCSTNASASNGGGIVEGDYLLFWCTVNFTGNWIPFMEWKTTHVQRSRHAINTNSATSSMPLQLLSDDDGTTISCKTSFNSKNYKHAREPREGESLADNVPNYQFLWTFKLNVLYVPNKITLTRWKSVYVVGEQLVCWANGNPTPTYEWMEIETNRTISGSVLYIDESLKPERNHEFRCTAYNTVAGIERQIADTVTFTVTDAASRETFASMLLITVIALGFAAVLSAKD